MVNHGCHGLVLARCRVFLLDCLLLNSGFCLTWPITRVRVGMSSLQTGPPWGGAERARTRDADEHADEHAPCAGNATLYRHQSNCRHFLPCASGSTHGRVKIHVVGSVGDGLLAPTIYLCDSPSARLRRHACFYAAFFALGAPA
ncbi:hypothetical protein F4809DRAFT_594538 [Biscogniauxia mediterranea]|nr:hypothetical protein F4809DRAFT_594538 [Biscogniauxia mediterranea]